MNIIKLVRKEINTRIVISSEDELQFKDQNFAPKKYKTAFVYKDGKQWRKGMLSIYLIKWNRVNKNII